MNATPLHTAPIPPPIPPVSPTPAPPGAPSWPAPGAAGVLGAAAVAGQLATAGPAPPHSSGPGSDGRGPASGDSRRRLRQRRRLAARSRMGGEREVVIHDPALPGPGSATPPRGALHVLSPRSARDLQGSGRRQHRPLRVRQPGRPDTVTLIANYMPLQDPDGGPNFFEFGDDVLYEIHISNRR